MLLCKRAIDPRYGYWTLPAGFMELGETSQAAALRETFEEANARVEILNLFAVFNLPHVSQVYMMFNSNLMDLNFSAGAMKARKWRCFPRTRSPGRNWPSPRFRYSLELFFEDRKNQSHRLHTGDIIRKNSGHELLVGPETRY